MKFSRYKIFEDGSYETFFAYKISRKIYQPTVNEASAFH